MTKQIEVYADWIGLNGQEHIGQLTAQSIRGREIFSFSYRPEWLEVAGALVLDPDLQLFTGAQYVRNEKPNFGLFTDSAPDRWGRVLMQRREALLAKKEERRQRTLMESDYLLGVFDPYRLGALRFKLDKDGPFLDDQATMAAPPMTALRTLEEASLHLEQEDAEDDPAFGVWLNQLLSPGASLGGARPKASVIDPEVRLWIAKFPSGSDDRDIGGWEAVVNELALRAGLNVAQGQARRLTRQHHTFLTRRFDRDGNRRIHFASAMTLLGRTDGADAAASSYLELAECIARVGARTNSDLEELWRRIVFNICISNADDHLRNHGFLLTSKGWVLSPAYDLNPVPDAQGLTLNIDGSSNALDLELAGRVAAQFRVKPERSKQIIEEVTKVVTGWSALAAKMGIPRAERERVGVAFEKASNRS
jgi:serine/threonine-protein kinase HipA